LFVVNLESLISNLYSVDEVEVFRRETELTLSVVEGENRKISGCLQGAPSSFSRIFELSSKIRGFPSSIKRALNAVE